MLTFWCGYEVSPHQMWSHIMATHDTHTWGDMAHFTPGPRNIGEFTAKLYYTEIWAHKEILYMRTLSFCSYIIMKQWCTLYVSLYSYHKILNPWPVLVCYHQFVPTHLADQHQAITWTNAHLLSIRPIGTSFSEILIQIQIFPFKRMHLKTSVKWQPFCPGGA